MDELLSIKSRKASMPDIRSKSVGPREFKLYRSSRQPATEKKQFPPLVRTIENTLYLRDQNLEPRVDITSIRQLGTADLMKLFNKTAIEQKKKERALKELHKTVDSDSRKSSKLQQMALGSIVDGFLKPHTEEFLQNINTTHKNQIRAAIETLDVSKWNNLMSTRCDLFERIFKDCMVKRLITDPALEDVVGVIAIELSSIFRDSQQFINDLNARMYKTISTTVETSKYDNILTECMQILNSLYNPIFNLNVDAIERNRLKLRGHLDYLQRNSFLSSNTDKIYMINNFECDMRKLNKGYIEVKQQHEIALAENKKFQEHIKELRLQIVDGKKLFDDRADQLKDEMDKRLLDLEPKLDSVPLVFHQAETKKFEFDNKTLQQEILLLKQQIKVLEEDSKQWKKIQADKKRRTVHNESQTETPQEQVKTVIESKLDKILQGSTNDLIKANIQKEHWLLSMIDIILQDKLVRDLMDDLELRPRKSLGGFLKDWFLLSFGMQIAAETFLGDFIISLKNYGSRNMRLKSFCMLANLASYAEQEEGDPQQASKNKSTGNQEQIQKEILKKRFMASPFCCSLYLKIVHLVKVMLDKNEFDHFQPSFLVPGRENYPATKLLNVLKEILRVCKVSESLSYQILTTFGNLAEKDLYMRISEKGVEPTKGDGTITAGGVTGSEFDIRFDTFVQFVIEKLVAIYIDNIYKMFTKTKLTQDAANSSDIDLEMFKTVLDNTGIKFSQRWQEVRFCEMLAKDIHHNPPLLQSFLPIIDNFYELDKIGYTDNGTETNPKSLTINSITDIRNKTYDVHGSANVLVETYRIIRESMNIYSKVTGNLDYIVHNFERDLNSITHFLTSVKDPTKVPMKEKERLIKNLDSCWNRFRKILKICYQK